MNWKTFKVVLMVIIAVSTLVWTISAILPATYSGSNLSFDVREGIVAITNPSQETIATQITGTGVRSFRLSSNVDDASGSSIRQVDGSTSTQLFDYGVPPGLSEFSIIRGMNVRFSATTGTVLDAVVNPLSQDARQTTLIIATIIIVAALFYASHITDHRWIGILRGEPAPIPKVIDETAAGGQGRPTRSYGDNHVE